MMNSAGRGRRGLINRTVHNRETKADSRSGQDERQTMHCTNPFPQNQAGEGLIKNNATRDLLQNRSWHL